MTGYLLHADADSFFASVVMRSRPELRVRPFAVVAHVFIASANYPARERGVRAAMLATEAQRICPDLVLVDVPQTEVEETSDALMDLFGEFARAVEPGSMEEAFLDVGAATPDAAAAAGAELRRRASTELGLSVSVGVGRTRLMAKLGSRAAKPDGLHVVGLEEEASLRDELPIGDVWGVGRRTRERLADLGVHRLDDVDAIDRDELARACGTGMARRLWAIRAGADDATVRPVDERATLSAELAATGYNRRDWRTEEMLERCIARVCRRASRAGLVANGLTIALRQGDKVVTLKTGLPDATADPTAWLEAAHPLLGPAHHNAAGLRVTLTSLRTAAAEAAMLF